MENESKPLTLRSRLWCGLAWAAATVAAWTFVFGATGLAGAASHPSFWWQSITLGAVLGLCALAYGFALGPERSIRRLEEEAPFRWRNVLVAVVVVQLVKYLVRLTG